LMHPLQHPFPTRRSSDLASIQLLHELDNITFDQKVIVSDVSSVKGTIFDVASELKNDKIVFIGGHPMAGSHKTGIHAAKAHLFEDRKSTRLNSSHVSISY